MKAIAKKTPYTFAEERVLKRVEEDVKNGRLNEKYTIDNSFETAKESYGLKLQNWKLSGEELYAVFYGDVRTFIEETAKELENNFNS